MHLVCFSFFALHVSQLKRILCSMSSCAAVFKRRSVLVELESLLFSKEDETSTREGTESLAKMCIMGRDLLASDVVLALRTEAEVRMHIIDRLVEEDREECEYREVCRDIDRMHAGEWYMSSNGL